MRNALIGLSMLMSGFPAGAAPPCSRILVEQARVEHELTPSILAQNEPAQRYRLEDRMAYYDVPAVSVAVIRRGRLVWARTWEVGRPASAPPISTETQFQAASISKSVTALGALRLVERKRLSLDSDINASLRSWHLPDDGLASGHKVSLRGLLSHTGGTSTSGFSGYVPGQPIPTLVQILDGRPPTNSPPVRMIAVPGERYVYSGGGYEIIQLLMEEEEKRPFAPMMKALVLDPLHMRRSSFAAPLDANAAPGHDATGKLLDGNWRIYPELAAAGLWTTPSDLARILIALHNGYRGRGPALLKTATVRMLIQPRAPGPYGLGFETSGTGKTFRLGHGGSSEGYKAQYWIYPANGDGAVVMTNGERGLGLVLELLRSISSVYGWPDFKPEYRTRITLGAAALQAFAGRYSPAGGSKDDALVVTVEGDHLLLRAPFGRWRMLPGSAHDFFDTDTGLTATFDGGANEISIGGKTLVRQP